MNNSNLHFEYIGTKSKTEFFNLMFKKKKYNVCTEIQKLNVIGQIFCSTE